MHGVSRAAYPPKALMPVARLGWGPQRYGFVVGLLARVALMLLR